MYGSQLGQWWAQSMHSRTVDDLYLCVCCTWKYNRWMAFGWKGGWTSTMWSQRRGWPFFSDLAPLVMLQKPVEVPLKALLIKKLTLWWGYVCPKDLLCQEFWHSSERAVHSLWRPKWLSFLIVVMSIYQALYRLWILCAWLGACGRQLIRSRYNLCHRDKFCLWSLQVEEWKIQPWSIRTKPSCHGNYFKHLCFRLPYSVK